MNSVKQLFKYVGVLLIIMSVSTFVNAQNSKKAEKAFNKAVKLIEKGKYEDAVTPLYEALVEEKEMKEGQDYKFVGGLLELLARFFISEDYYGAASQNYFLASLSYQHGGYSEKAQDALTQSAYFEDSAAKYQSKYAYGGSYLGKEYTRYRITSVTDTFEAFKWFTMDLGTRDSIKVGQTGWLVTIYDANNPERDVISYGKTTCSEVEFGKSKWIVIPSEEGKASGFTPQVGDLNYLKVASNPDAYDGLLLELTRYDILLQSDYKNPLYSYKNVQMITKAESEEAIIEVMRDIIVGTAKSLYDPESGNLTNKLDSGAFKGYNMWEAMLMTTVDDVKAYLRFVANFPGKYMGRDFRVDETYATWVINYTPLSNEDAHMFDSLYQTAVTDTEWEQWVKVYGRYLKSAEFDFSAVQTRIYDLIGEKKYDAAEEQIVRWLEVTEEYGFAYENQGFALARAWSLRQQKRFDDSEEVYTNLLKESPNDVNLRWLRGLLYLDAEDIMKALPEFEYVKDSASYFAGGHGMYGWSLMRLGQFKKAEEHAKKGYELDSFSAPYVMNYGHSQLLLRRYNTARELYMKVFDRIETQEEFTEGLIDDFNIFIDNGWEVEEVTREMTHLTNEWNTHYKYKTIGNEFFEKGQKLEKIGKHKEAAFAFDTAIANEKQGRNIRFGLLRSYYRWSAYNYYKETDFETSLDRYTQAWDLNLNFINDPELEMADLEAISNVNDWLNNDVMEDMFDKMKFAAQRKLQSKQRSNNLYFISIGTNGKTKNGYKQATDDAQHMADVVSKKAQRIFDNSYLYVINQDKKDSVQKAFNHVITHTKPGDCFILYYTGYTSNDKLIVGDDTITNEQILAWLSSMSATKKLLLIDAANSTLIDNYVASERENSKDFRAESVSFLISDGRVEMPRATGSVFTSYLTSGFEGQAATTWKNDFHKDTTASIAYVTSKSLEGFMYGNMSSGNLQFDLKSYSNGVDFPLTFVNTSSHSIDTIPPMIYIPNVINTDGKRGGKTKIVTISKNVGGQALDESGIEEITVNGFPVTFTQNGKFNLDQNFTQAWTKLVISAKDKRGNVAIDSFFVNQNNDRLADPSQLNSAQTNYALLFATSNYDEWSDLANPLQDVTKIGNLLRENYGFKVDIMVDFTIEQMDSIIDVYTKKTYAPKDQLFVFFAGHGHYVPGRGGHIVAKNSQLNGSLRSYLEFNDIRTYFNNIYSCKHMMLVFDVCFGGAAFDKQDAINYSGSSLKQIRDSLDKFVETKSKIQSRLFITSGSLEYVPDESQFALKFIETLETNGSRKGNVLTFDDFTDNLQTMALLPKEKNPTTPKFGTFGDHQSGGDFIFIYKQPGKIESYDMTKGEIKTNK